jgi:hypothetical protein
MRIRVTSIKNEWFAIEYYGEYRIIYRLENYIRMIKVFDFVPTKPKGLKYEMIFIDNEEYYLPPSP